MNVNSVINIPIYIIIIHTVDYNTTDVSDIHKYFMKRQNIKQCLD